jgi:DNA-binding response OmpR family regulator
MPALILLVEDHAEMRRFLGTELRRDGYSVIELASGDDALVWLARSRCPQPSIPAPDLVISDVRMPGSGGFEILETLRAQRDPLPAILITAFPDATARGRARDLGADLIAKPFDMAELLATTHRILDPPSRDDHSEGHGFHPPEAGL